MDKIKPIDIIKFAFELFYKNTLFIVTAILLLLTCSLLFSSIQNAMFQANSVQWVVFSITSQLFTMGLSLGFVNIVIELYFGKTVSLSHLFNKFDVVFSYLFASTIFAVSICIAMLPGLLILITSMDVSEFLKLNINDLLNPQLNHMDLNPISFNNRSALGIFIMFCGFFYTYIRLQFYQQAILYKNYRPLQSIISSATITKNNVFQLSTILLIIISINIVGALLVFGLLFTIPISMIVMIVAYFKLLNVDSAIN
tara:strand:+ start:690 stop:1454 length:765 start_codon:yes stop_codon:yes gene_type:complete